MKRKALIAMSGGVDSSVAAASMMKKGYECIGCTMKLLSSEEDAGTGRTCCSLEDVEDAREVAFSLGMPYYVFNFTEAFSEEVIGKFVRVYEAGGTPNPCIDCNRYMKFGKLLDRAVELGCDVIVTGHYARVRVDEKTGRMLLLRALNESKDQTYVLYGLTQEMLARTLFPLGEIGSKEEVRRIAEEYGFVNSKKPDSQDLCFVRSGSYADYIEARTGRSAQPGNFVDEEGNILGTHRGMIRYTIGQRNGLGLALPRPMYVKRKDPEKNEVVLAYADGLFSDRLVAEDFNWIWTPDLEKGQIAPPEGTRLKVTAKPRYRAKESPAEAVVLEGGKVEIRFLEMQRALTVGQAVVLYDGEKVVGGGTICEV